MQNTGVANKHSKPSRRNTQCDCDRKRKQKLQKRLRVSAISKKDSKPSLRNAHPELIPKTLESECIFRKR